MLCCVGLCVFFANRQRGYIMCVCFVFFFACSAAVLGDRARGWERAVCSMDSIHNEAHGGNRRCPRNEMNYFIKLMVNGDQCTEQGR